MTGADELSPGEGSLLRVTQLLHVAAERADVPGLSMVTDLPAMLLRDAVRGLVWQAMVLLPEGLPLAGAQASRPGCLGALEEAEQELRALPIGQYPAGTSALGVAVCDTIAITRAGEWLS